jgi:hypothetical protein
MKARALVLFVCISLAAVAALAHGGEEHVIGTWFAGSQAL